MVLGWGRLRQEPNLPCPGEGFLPHEADYSHHRARSRRADDNDRVTGCHRPGGQSGTARRSARAGRERRGAIHRCRRRRTGERRNALHRGRTAGPRPSRDQRGIPRRHRRRPTACEVPGRRTAQRQPVPDRLRRNGSHRGLRTGLFDPAGRRLHLRASTGGTQRGGRLRLRRQHRRSAGRGDAGRQGRALRLPGGRCPLRGQLSHRGRVLRLPFDAGGGRRLHPLRPGSHPGKADEGLPGGRVPTRRAA